MDKAFSKIWIISISVVIFVGGFFAWQYFGAQKEIQPRPAEQATKDETANWATLKNDQLGFEMKYPEGIAEKYIGTQTWPPKISISPSDPNFVCEELPQIKTSLGYGNQKELRVNNSKYCVTTVKEGAMGKLYTTYKYITDKDGKQLSLEFTLWSVNCGAVNDNDMEVCEEEERNFDPTGLIDQIFSTFRFLPPR